MDIRIQRLVAIIKLEPHQRHSLDSMASIAGLSSSRLRHKFKSEIGVTPRTYLHTVRMEMADELLKSSSMSVKEVRVAIGLTSDSYFTREFKRTFGIPPSRIRKL